MRIAVAAAAAVLTLASASVAQSWSTQRFAEQKLTLEAPLPLKVSGSQKLDSGGDMHTFVASGAEGFFLVTATNVGGAPDLQQAKPDDVTASVVQGAVSEGAQLLSQRVIAYPGGGARDFVARHEGVMIRTRVVYHSPWIYTASVMAPGDDPKVVETPTYERFLNSVKGGG